MRDDYGDFYGHNGPLTRRQNALTAHKRWIMSEWLHRLRVGDATDDFEDEVLDQRREVEAWARQERSRLMSDDEREWQGWERDWASYCDEFIHTIPRLRFRLFLL